MTHAFSEKTFPHIYENLPPDALRRKAWELFEQSGGLPGRHEEAWRWSDMKAALAGFDSTGKGAGTHHTVLPDMTAGTGAHEIRCEDGVLVAGREGLPEGLELTCTGIDMLSHKLRPFLSASGMTVADDAGQGRGETTVSSSSMTPSPVPLALALAPQLITLRVRAGVCLKRPVHLIWTSTKATTVHTVFQLIVEHGAEITLLETLDPQTGYMNGAGLFLLEQGARLGRFLVQGGHEHAVITRTDAGRLSPGACWRQNALAFGARLARLETHLRLEGEEIETHLDGAYLLEGSRHADFTSKVDHHARACQTRQHIKGVATDKARGVFQGLFHVAREADKTDARMKHQALLLSKTARAAAKPELEIYADDVQCSHGCTTGSLDEAALFYMRQRGLPEVTARALLTEAFLVEVFDKIGHDSLRETWRRAVQTWLGAVAFDKEAA